MKSAEEFTEDFMDYLKKAEVITLSESGPDIDEDCVQRELAKFDELLDSSMAETIMEF